MFFWGKPDITQLTLELHMAIQDEINSLAAKADAIKLVLDGMAFPVSPDITGLAASLDAALEAAKTVADKSAQ